MWMDGPLNTAVYSHIAQDVMTNSPTATSGSTTTYRRTVLLVRHGRLVHPRRVIEEQVGRGNMYEVCAVDLVALLSRLLMLRTIQTENSLHL